MEFWNQPAKNSSLQKRKRKSAEEKYNAVGKWLNAGGIIMIYDPDISGQGSIMIGTTVKPIRRIEFDVDLLCNLAKGSRDLDQWYVKKMIGNRLREHGTYGKMLEDINRGWRLNYTGEFHMDITPAVPNLLCANGLMPVWNSELIPKDFAAGFSRMLNRRQRNRARQL